MSTSTNTYIIVGADVGPDWGKLSTDGTGDQDEYDDWCDRYGDLIIYRAKPGDVVAFEDYMSGKYFYIGRIIAVDYGRDSDGTDFSESFDVTRLAKEIDEVTLILKERYDITIPVQLHIVSNVV